MNKGEKGCHPMKSSMIHEIRTFIILTLYLTLFFCALTMYRRFILADETLGAFRYGYNLFEAMILAKIILLGQMLKLGSNKFLDHPLIFPTLYKSAIFCLFVVV